MDDKWVRDTGLVAVLISLLVAYRGSTVALTTAVGFTLVTILFPALLRPLAWVWFQIARFVSEVMQYVFFGLIFSIVITPIGLLRRILKGDARDLQRDNTHSTAFVPMKGLVTREDVALPY